MLDLDPSEITFDLSETEPTSVLKVRNGTSSQVAFKVKTTNPKRYLVRPNQDVVQVGASMNVRISLQTKEAKLIVDSLSADDVDVSDVARDKFMIQSIELQPEFKEQVDKVRLDPSTKPMSDILSGLWQQAKKEDLSNVKLKCKFIVPNETKVAASEEKKNNVLEEITGSSLNSGDYDDLTSLRRKYNELVNFTVQLTAERDRLKHSCKEASKELNSLRQGGGSSGGRTQVASMSKEVVGFSLWQIMLVSVVAFLLGRIIGT